MRSPFFRFRAGGRFVRLWSAAPPLFALGGGSAQDVTEYNLAFMMGIVGVCLAAGLILGLMARRARRAQRVEGQLSDEVLETLQRAMDRGSRLDMYPVQRAGTSDSPVLSGRCAACSFTDLRLSFELTEKQPGWPHTAVDIYFHEQGDDGQTTFYAFTSGIERMTVEDGRLLVDMPLPNSLRREQKRAMFRLALPQAMVHALALWPMDDFQELAEQTDSRALGAPLFAWRPPRIRQASVLDISAGGIRLRLDAERCRQFDSTPGTGARLLMLTVFGDGRGATDPRQFWFKCVGRHARVLEDNGDVSIGMQFFAWGLTNTLSDPVVWQDVQGNGEVPPLFEWLMDYSLRTPPGSGPGLPGR